MRRYRDPTVREGKRGTSLPPSPNCSCSLFSYRKPNMSKTSAGTADGTSASFDRTISSHLISSDVPGLRCRSRLFALAHGMPCHARPCVSLCACVHQCAGWEPRAGVGFSTLVRKCYYYYFGLLNRTARRSGSKGGYLRYCTVCPRVSSLREAICYADQVFFSSEIATARR